VHDDRFPLYKGIPERVLHKFRFFFGLAYILCDLKEAVGVEYPRRKTGTSERFVSSTHSERLARSREIAKRNPPSLAAGRWRRLLPKSIGPPLYSFGAAAGANSFAWMLRTCTQWVVSFFAYSS